MMAALVGASGLLATVTGLVVNRAFNPIADGVADVVDASPLVAYYAANSEAEALNGIAYAFDHALPADVVAARQDAVAPRLVAERVVPVAETSAGVTLENARTETVVITSVKAVIRNRTAAPADTLVVPSGTGGPGEGPVRLHFDLDAVDTEARTMAKGALAGKYLDEHGLTLEPKEKLRFILTGHAAKDQVEWGVRIGYIVNQKARVLDLLPRGKPLRVTGAAPAYRDSFSWSLDGLTREPLTRFCPVDCRTKIVA
jgi:hypothetical protein